MERMSMIENKVKPPKLAVGFLLRFLREDLAEEVLGDLEEKFYLACKKSSVTKAKLMYWYQVLHYIRPFAIRKMRYQQLNHYDMYKSYIRIGWRNLLKNKSYSIINIGGLAVGMSVAMLIGMWVYDELSFDRYHQNYDRIGRIVRTGTLNGVTGTTTFLPYALGDELQTKYGSNFKHVIKSWPVRDHILSFDDKINSYKGGFVEPGAPEMFTFKMLKGSLQGLKDPHSIFISASLSKILFGDEDPIGKHMRIDNSMDVSVTGVYEDLPHNSHFYRSQFFAPWELLVSVNSWMLNQGFKNNFLDIYVELSPSTNFENASASIKDAILDNVRDDKEYVAVNPQLFVHPMSKWHLQSEWKNGKLAGGLLQFVWLFGVVGVFVLLLACINFMNLSTARSEKRAKEVGIRKTMGSFRGQLIHQFFSESFLVVILAFVFALLIVMLSLGWFNELAGKQMTMLWSSPYFWGLSVAFILITGLLAGSYPAIYLSSFRPVSVLKGVFRAGRFASLPRKVLVVLQFTVSVTLVIGTIIVYQQIQHAKDRPVGYNREGLLMVEMTSRDYYPKIMTLQDELRNSGVVEEVSLCTGPTTEVWSSNGGFNWRDKDPAFQAEFATLAVTHEYGKTVGWQFVDGRDFSRDLASDSSGFVITEGAAKVMNLEDPIGEIVHWAPGWRPAQDFKIIGVIKNITMTSPFSDQLPTVYFIDQSYNWINIRIRPTAGLPDALAKISAVFKKVVPTVPFNYKFADEEYSLKFAAEERIGELASVFSALAIMISCLGLFGLASFVAEQRTKEIGIRKVVGASVFNLWSLLSKDFVILVVIASVIAIPIAYYFLSDWLNNYDYRIGISGWVFFISTTSAVVITLATVSYQAIKAALMNPVQSLKTE
ncbi:MAG TPA: ABC transporter permease [Chryseolinea sp.]